MEKSKVYDEIAYDEIVEALSELSLLSCPFCGERGKIDSIRDWLFLGKKTFYIECEECLAASDFHNTLDAAAGAWNKRDE